MKRTPWSTCKATGKRRFRNERDAETALRGAKKTADRHRRGEHIRREIRYYDCDDCGGFHLTSLAGWMPEEVAP